MQVEEKTVLNLCFQCRQIPSKLAELCYLEKWHFSGKNAYLDKLLSCLSQLTPSNRRIRLHHTRAMVKLGLFIKAELDGVTNLTPADSAQDPYFYTFKVVCNSCHEVNESWVTISRQVQWLRLIFLVNITGKGRS